MKKLVFDGLLIILLYLVIQNIIFIFVNPYWGNECFESKFEIYQRDSTKYNTIIYGTSIFYRGINPVLFDSILKNYNIKTFNLACPGTYNPEEMFLINTSIENVKYLPKFLIIELISFKNIEHEWDNTIKCYYWINGYYLKYILMYLLHSDYSISEKATISIDFIQSLINKYFKFSILKFVNLNIQADSYNKEIQGHIPLDSMKSNFYIERHRKFLNNQFALKNKRKNLEKEFLMKNVNNTINSFYYEYLNQLIVDYQKKGIHIVYVIPPKAKTLVQEIALSNVFPSKNFIELADPNKFPELYEVDNSFDYIHLNAKGARILTKLLADKFKENVLIKNINE